MKVRKCDVCGKEYPDVGPNYGEQYGFVALNNSGDLYLAMDLCDECRGDMVTLLEKQLNRR